MNSSSYYRHRTLWRPWLCSVAVMALALRPDPQYKNPGGFQDVTKGMNKLTGSTRALIEGIARLMKLKSGTSVAKADFTRKQIAFFLREIELVC